VIVQGGLIYSILRFRAKATDTEDAAPVRGHSILEIVWTAIPAGIVTTLAILSYATLTTTEAAQPDALVVQVTARQFAWDFYYPHRDVHSPELHVPRGQQVLLQMVSKDVIHAFWIPDFRINKDVMPDRMTEVRFTGDKDGTYPIVCSRICGVGHAFMRSNAIVQEQADFDTWLGQQAGTAAVAASGNDTTAAARQLFNEQGCNACHTLAAAQAAGKVGPDLDHMATEAANRIKDPSYKGQAKTPEDYIKESIVSPNAYITPGYQANIMPQDFGKRLTDQQINTLVQYLAAQK
jgi:cytochrome c oxidase subunit II